MHIALKPDGSVIEDTRWWILIDVQENGVSIREGYTYKIEKIINEKGLNVEDFSAGLPDEEYCEFWETGVYLYKGEQVLPEEEVVKL